MTKVVKFSLFFVLFATIGINVFFIVETTKKLNLQTTADYSAGYDTDGALGLSSSGARSKGQDVKEFNHFYNNDLVPPTSGSDSETLPYNNHAKNNQKFHNQIQNQEFDLSSGESNRQNRDVSINGGSGHRQRSNQLKLQELGNPKYLSIEVLSSKTKVSVTIDGTTVRIHMQYNI